MSRLSQRTLRQSPTHGLDTLGYILDMARLEAENVARKSTGLA